jgi:hypothetical protein
MEYDKNFVDTCEELFKKIKQNMPIQECLNTATTAAAMAPTDPYDPLWFVYYMFFAIHNPKMEDYIQKKMSTNMQRGGDIIKNMIKRRHHTSTIVFQLYTHAYTNQGNVTHIYPKYKDEQLIKSYQSNHLKTTAVHIRRTFTSAAAAATQTAFIEYVITTAPTIPTASNTAAVMNKINKDISYKRKDLIVLTLACYMKIAEEDINQKNIFIAATPEEMNQDATTAIAATEPEIPSTSVYDQKYKYLYT